jgi:tetratricopeptide (TPR) repeat protein
VSPRAWGLALALAAAGALRADITIYPAGQVLAPSTELPPFAEGATAGAFLGSVEGPGAALLDPAALGFSGYPFLALSGVGPYNTSTEFSDFELGYSQPLGDGGLSLFLRDYRLGAYDLYDATGADQSSWGGLMQGGSEFYMNASGAWRLSPGWSLGLGLGQGYTLLPGVGTYYRPADVSVGSSWRWQDAGATSLSLALRQAPVQGPWQASAASATLGVERDLAPGALRLAAALEEPWSTAWQGRLGLRWTLREGAFSVLAGALLRPSTGDPAQAVFSPSAGLNAQFTNLAGTLALSTGDDHSFQFTTELDWRFRPDAFSANTLMGPDASRSYQDAGLKERSLGHLASALVLLSKALEADPGNAEAGRQRDDLSASIGTASREAQELHEMRAGAEYFSKLAEDDIRKGDLRQAVANFEWAIKVDDQNKAIYERLQAIKAELQAQLDDLQGKAAAAESAGDPEAAAKACHQALALDGAQAWAGIALARMAPALAGLRHRLYLQAVDQYVKASTDTHRSAGDRQQLTEAALGGLQRALALDPTPDEQRAMQGAVYKCEKLRKWLGH